MSAPQFIHNGRQPVLCFVSLPPCFQGQLGAEDTAMHAGQLERDEPQADAPLPCFAEQDTQAAIHVGFQVGRFTEAFAALVFLHVVVTHLHREGADALSIRPNLGHQIIRHASQDGFHILLVGDVGAEGLLLAVGLGRLSRWHYQPLVHSVGEEL